MVTLTRHRDRDEEDKCVWAGKNMDDWLWALEGFVRQGREEAMDSGQHMCGKPTAART